MSIPSLATKRVLAIDPTTKGFGFAVLEGPEVLVDWGMKQVRGDLSRRNRRCLEEILKMITRFQPDVLVVERTGVKSCRRRRRARRLMVSLLALARSHRLRTRRVSRRSVQRCFSETGSATKRQIAVALSERFPELGPHLPPERKPWMPEDERMGIFDAAAFGWKFYAPLRRERRALALLEEPSALSNA